MTNLPKGQKALPQSPRSSDVFVGLAIFLTINFLVAAIYFKLLNP